MVNLVMKKKSLCCFTKLQLKGPMALYTAEQVGKKLTYSLSRWCFSVLF